MIVPYQNQEMLNKFISLSLVLSFNSFVFISRVEAGPTSSPVSVSVSSSNEGLQRILFSRIDQITPAETSLSVIGLTVIGGVSTAKEIKFKTDNHLGRVCTQLVQTAFLSSRPFIIEINQADSLGNLQTCRLSVSSSQR